MDEEKKRTKRNLNGFTTISSEAINCSALFQVRTTINNRRKVAAAQRSAACTDQRTNATQNIDMMRLNRTLCCMLKYKTDKRDKNRVQIGMRNKEKTTNNEIVESRTQGKLYS